MVEPRRSASEERGSGRGSSAFGYPWPSSRHRGSSVPRRQPESSLPSSLASSFCYEEGRRSGGVYIRVETDGGDCAEIYLGPEDLKGAGAADIRKALLPTPVPAAPDWEEDEPGFTRRDSELFLISTGEDARKDTRPPNPQHPSDSLTLKLNSREGAAPILPPPSISTTVISSNTAPSSEPATIQESVQSMVEEILSAVEQELASQSVDARRNDPENGISPGCGDRRQTNLTDEVRVGIGHHQPPTQSHIGGASALPSAANEEDERLSDAGSVYDNYDGSEDVDISRQHVNQQPIVPANSEGRYELAAAGLTQKGDFKLASQPSAVPCLTQKPQDTVEQCPISSKTSPSPVPKADVARSRSPEPGASAVFAWRPPSAGDIRRPESLQSSPASSPAKRSLAARLFSKLWGKKKATATSETAVGTSPPGPDPPELLLKERRANKGNEKGPVAKNEKSVKQMGAKKKNEPTQAQKKVTNDKSLTKKQKNEPAKKSKSSNGTEQAETSTNGKKNSADSGNTSETILLPKSPSENDSSEAPKKATKKNKSSAKKENNASNSSNDKGPSEMPTKLEKDTMNIGNSAETNLLPASSNENVSTEGQKKVTKNDKCSTKKDKSASKRSKSSKDRDNAETAIKGKKNTANGGISSETISLPTFNEANSSSHAINDSETEDHQDQDDEEREEDSDQLDYENIVTGSDQLSSGSDRKYVPEPGRFEEISTDNEKNSRQQPDVNQNDCQQTSTISAPTTIKKGKKDREAPLSDNEHVEAQNSDTHRSETEASVSQKKAAKKTRRGRPTTRSEDSKSDKHKEEHIPAALPGKLPNIDDRILEDVFDGRHSGSSVRSDEESPHYTDGSEDGDSRLSRQTSDTSVRFDDAAKDFDGGGDEDSEGEGDFPPHQSAEFGRPMSPVTRAPSLSTIPDDDEGRASSYHTATEVEEDDDERSSASFRRHEARCDRSDDEDEADEDVNGNLPGDALERVTDHEPGQDGGRGSDLSTGTTIPTTQEQDSARPDGSVMKKKKAAKAKKDKPEENEIRELGGECVKSTLETQQPNTTYLTEPSPSLPSEMATNGNDNVRRSRSTKSKNGDQNSPKSQSDENPSPESSEFNPAPKDQQEDGDVTESTGTIREIIQDQANNHQEPNADSASGSYPLSRTHHVPSSDDEEDAISDQNMTDVFDNIQGHPSEFNQSSGNKVGALEEKPLGNIATSSQKSASTKSKSKADRSRSKTAVGEMNPGATPISAKASSSDNQSKPLRNGRIDLDCAQSLAPDEHSASAKPASSAAAAPHSAPPRSDSLGGESEHLSSTPSELCPVPSSSTLVGSCEELGRPRRFSSRLGATDTDSEAGSEPSPRKRLPRTAGLSAAHSEDPLTSRLLQARTAMDGQRSASLSNVHWRQPPGANGDLNRYASYASSLYLEDEMLSGENSTLRERVHSLERRVAEQEDELVCFRSSMADVLRRLREMEAAKGEDVRGTVDRLTAGLPTSGSRTGSLRRHLSASTLASSPQTPSRRSSASPAQRRVAGKPPRPTSLVNGISGSPSPASSPTGDAKANRRSSVGVSLGRLVTSPLNGMGGSKRWMSTTDFNDGTGGLVATSPSRRGLSARRFGSSASLAAARHSSARLSDVGLAHEPSYSPRDGLVTLNVRGRAVKVPAPLGTTPGYTPAGGDLLGSHAAVAAPKEHLKLEWVYGYRGKDGRGNLELLPTGELIYYVAAVVVLWNPEERTQRHYKAHTDDVRCIAVHPNRLTIASGQCAQGIGIKNRKLWTPTDMDELLEETENVAHVRVWDSLTLHTQHVVGIGEFERSVACLAFSRADGGNLLAVVDDSFEHTLSLWDWQRRKKLTETKSANEQVFSVAWHPLEKGALVTCGKSHIAFWTFDGTCLQKRLGIMEGREKAKYMLCIAFNEQGQTVSGDSNGTLALWDHRSGRTLTTAPKAHDGGIFWVCPLKGGRLLSGGGKDRRILEWTSELRGTGLAYTLQDSAGPVRTLCQGPGDLVFVATTHNAVLRGDLSRGFHFLLQAHTDEVWAAAPHPVQAQFLSVAFDKTLRVWDAVSKALCWTTDIADPALSCCWHPGGGVVAVGTTVGAWVVVDALSRGVVTRVSEGTAMIGAVAFSPDGRLLAVASHDGALLLYTVSPDARKYSRLAACPPLPSPIRALDWSRDGHHLRLSTAQLQLHHFAIPECKAEEAGAVRGAEWATAHCPLTFDTLGLWPDGDDGAELRAVDARGKFAAAATDAGSVRLYHFPATQLRGGFSESGGHSSPATCVRFLSPERLVSAGAKDYALMQWRIAI